MRKILIVTWLLLLFSSPVLAGTTISFGGSYSTDDGNTRGPIYAEHIVGQMEGHYFTSAKFAGTGTGMLRFYDANQNEIPGKAMNITPSMTGMTVNFPPNSAGFSLTSETGAKIYTIIAYASGMEWDAVTFDAPELEPKNLEFRTRYIPDRDLKEVTYSGWPSGITKYELEFVSSNGNRYVRTYTQSPTGIHYLTCNAGDYTLNFYDSAGRKVAKAGPIPVNELKNPTCNSFEGDTQPIDGATPGTGGTETTPGGGTNPGTDPGTDPGTGEECETEACKELKETLECPYWDDVMGDVTNAVENAFDWDEIADTISDDLVPKIDGMLGHPAPPPSISAPSVPSMNGTDGLGRPDYPYDPTPPAENKDAEIENTPSVPVAPDDTGGIDLMTADPIENVPHDHEDYMPMPGQETGGEKPFQKTTEMPKPKGGELTEVPGEIPSVLQPPSTEPPRPGAAIETPPSPVNPGATITPPPAPEMPMPEGG